MGSETVTGEDKATFAQEFCRAHYRAGHNYVVTAVGEDDWKVECECGEHWPPDVGEQGMVMYRSPVVS